MNTGEHNMNIEIDSFTPCLIERKTGKTISTTYAKVTKKELLHLKNQGWNFNWTDKALTDCEIYKLSVKGPGTIQGLIALINEPKSNAIYVSVAESAPNNSGKSKEYEGVGGHLFAIAAQLSVNSGYGGFVYMDAKNQKLVEHYRNALGAIHIGGIHPYRMIVDESAAANLLKMYTLEVD